MPMIVELEFQNVWPDLAHQQLSAAALGG